MIERMEDFILTGMGIPFTPFTIVNGEKLVPLLDRIRENLPAEIQHAQRVLDRRDEIVNEAQSKAGQVLQDAKKQSEFMLSESELLRAVHEEANRIRQQITMELEAMRKKTFEEAEAAKAQAYEEANAIRVGADQYAEAILGSLDKSLVEFQSVVKNGQRYLKKARMDAAQQLGTTGRGQSSNYVPSTPMDSSYSEQAHNEPTYSPGSPVSSSYAQEFLRQTTLSGNP
jgi:cell division septum initiation protein DivIVA